eukprot:COSAG01_NODE_30551_length_613_cov_194.937743_1_plen_32_part_01
MRSWKHPTIPHGPLGAMLDIAEYLPAYAVTLL